MGEKGNDQSDIEWVVNPEGLALSISETGDLLGFSCPTISWVYRESSEKERIL